MTFKEAGDSAREPRFKEAGASPEKNEGPLNLKWYRLEDYECPKCGESLTHFENIDMWKCGCGFKINNTRLVEIIQKIDEAQGFNSGFRYGNYHDEPPF